VDALARVGGRRSLAAMTRKDRALERFRTLIGPYRVTHGRHFRLDRIDPGDTGPFGKRGKAEARELLAEGIERLRDAQERLYAQNRWSLLLVLQAMDAAGKDSTIEHVMSGVNPQGCTVTPFKQPSPEELDHDYLWRCVRRLPERGTIGIFNRSYYEEVLVVRVHEEILAGQQLPAACLGPGIFDERLEDMAAFERYLGRNGTRVLKCFLHVSREEQKRRFLDRLDRPEKHWKFSPDDVHERDHWDAYMRSYEAAIRATATRDAPWFVVPADHKWFTRAVVAAAVVVTLEDLDLHYPEVDEAARSAMAVSRRLLEGENDRTRGSKGGRKEKSV
jgi:PPK2 family polyphosphate:nucleotide phosphotransferase